MSNQIILIKTKKGDKICQQNHQALRANNPH